MSFDIDVPLAPVVENYDPKPVLEPFQLPTAGEPETYVRALKLDCPKEYLNIGPISFEKRNYSPDFSLAENQDKPIQAKVSTVLLSKEQAEYVKERANQLKESIRCRDENDVLVRVDMCYGDYIVLVPLSEYGEEQKRQVEAYAKGLQDSIKRKQEPVSAERIEAAIIDLEA